MITLPGDIKTGDTWDSRVPPAGEDYASLDSNMDFDEHARIVIAARSLIASYAAKHTGWKTSTDDVFAITAFDHLKDCYEKTGGSYVLYLTKGIHQPRSNPHLTLTLAEPGKHKLSGARKFYLNVTATLARGEVGEAHPTAFVWEPVQLTYAVKDKIYKWPLAAPLSMKKGDWSGLPGQRRQRAGSISSATHTERKQAIEEQKAAEAERKRQENEKRRLELEEAERKRKAQAEAETREKARQEEIKRHQSLATDRGKLLSEFLSKQKGLPKVLKKHKDALWKNGSVQIEDKGGLKGGTLTWTATTKTFGLTRN